MSFSSSEIIEYLHLEPLPLEGGYYRRSYETSESIDLGKGFDQLLGTAIYFLLTTDSFSAFHHLTEDEVYHFYLGDPVELYELSSENGLNRTVLGQNLAKKQQVQYPVLKNKWHGSRLMEGGQWALLGTTMAPGFLWEDFKLGKREHLVNLFPEHQKIINELTRE